MDPFTLAIQGAGLAVSLFGAFGSSGTVQAQKGIASSQGQIANLEMQQNDVRRQAMEFDASRRNMEVLRNVQKARSLATAAAVGSGSQYGSGVQGGYGQISGYGNTNLQGIQANLGFGEKEFALTDQIDQQKMNIAQYQSQLATGTGMQNLGKTLMGSGSTIGNIGQDIYSGVSSTANFFSKQGLIGLP